MIKKIKENKIYIVLAIIFLFTLLLNALTPIIADDFGYSLNLDKEHLRGIKDIINFQIIHYQYWGGRSVAHTLVQFFLWLPKWVFNICNSLCFTLLIYLIYRIAKQDKKDNLYLLGIIFFALYFITPVFGQNILWLTGSCNYLWTTTIIVFIINLYLSKGNDMVIYKILIFFLGIVAGWTNENTAVGLIIVLTILTFLEQKKNKKFSSWRILGLIGSIIGFIIMIIAPGNYLRSDSYQEELSLIAKLFHRFLNCTVGIFKYLYPLLIFLVIIFIISIYKKKKINKIFYLFVIGSFFNVYSMVLSPTFPERAWFSTIVFILIATITLCFELNIKSRISKYLKATFILLFIIFLLDYSTLIIDIKKLHDTWKYRIDYIKKNSDKEEFVFDIYTTDNKKNPLYGQMDIAEDPKIWPNEDLERYFKIKSIRIK